MDGQRASWWMRLFSTPLLGIQRMVLSESKPQGIMIKDRKTILRLARHHIRGHTVTRYAAASNIHLAAKFSPFQVRTFIPGVMAPIKIASSHETELLGATFAASSSASVVMLHYSAQPANDLMLTDTHLSVCDKSRVSITGIRKHKALHYQ